jgi:hypothetical protein
MAEALNCRVGELVEVRSEAEILATLGGDGTLDHLPFMPEMLAYCGRQFRVYRRADKTCDTIHASVSRRMLDTVHLEGLRCSGSAHGGCQAECLLFWKEAWLKRVEPGHCGAAAGARNGGMSRDELERTTRRPVESAEPEAFVCQATELRKASSELWWFDLRQYLRELRSGNESWREMLKVFAIAWYNVLGRRLAPLGFRRYPNVAGKCTKATPTASLGLRAGELVRIKSKEQIRETLGPDRKNRGLLFDVEMAPFCGGEYRVRRRVERIINEKTGVMIALPRDCIMLEGVYCKGRLSKDRLFCPRSIPSYWREIWLERAAPSPASSD